MTIREGFIDIVKPEQGSEIIISHDGQSIWINVDGKCTLRICQNPNVTIRDMRIQPEDEKGI